ncbi:hypothetical protein F5Y18DRAFT_326559 [Xylariaceae sp. FL1019]|nr:hypothetical protein F5Y18DRAFT_326559 [Xylariaceae sp. FL1019]
MSAVLSRIYKRPGFALDAVLNAQANVSKKLPISKVSDDAETVKSTCDSFTFKSFLAEDAWDLGHLLYARLLPYAVAGQPTLISIALANNSHVLFQAAVGTGTAPDNSLWVERKRNTVLRFGTSTWYQHCKYRGNEAQFRAKFGMSEEQASQYAIHGGGVPIFVEGVEGVVAVVVVSGLKQDQDHGVIVDVINDYWEKVSG